MAEEIRIWQVENGKNLLEITRSKLDFEERLETWLNQDISILSGDLLIIGRQVATEYGKYIDLICLNSDGDVIIIELKKDKTPREVTAQVLDYASWVKDLSTEKIQSIASHYLAEKTINLEEAFKQKFKFDLPEELNESHAMLIVASEIDESTERIIKYLSGSYGVNINVAQFQYFKNEIGQEFLARILLLEQSEVEQKAQSKGTKRLPFPKPEELEKIADDNDVGDLYRKIVNGLSGKFTVTTRRTMINFYGNIGNINKAIFNLVPEKSSSTRGVYFQIYILRIIDYTGLSEDSILNILPSNRRNWKYYKTASEDYSGYEGFFCDDDEVEKFLNGLQNVIRH
jgi:hypothetical protein